MKTEILGEVPASGRRIDNRVRLPDGAAAVSAEAPRRGEGPAIGAI